MTTKSRSALILARALKLAAVVIVLWLVIIAPFVSIFSLLLGEAFFAWWFQSLLLLPWPLGLFFAVSRANSKTFRWWNFQYLGICGVCFSAALVGIGLSLFLPLVVSGKIALGLCFIFCAWAVYSAHRIHVINITIASAKIKQPLRLVQISDVHIGSRSPAFLEKVIALVDKQSLDLLAITGDLIDENVAIDALKPLSTLAYPAFYCSGNHERYVDYQVAIDNIAKQGVVVLSDSVASCLGLKIIGIQDRENVSHAQSALETLRTSDLGDMAEFSLLLYHQPDLWDSAKHHGIDLTLSGHTHKGQVWPFGLIVRARYRYVSGLFKEASSHLYVSQGTGTWGPIMRFGTRCEITVIELTSGE